MAKREIDEEMLRQMLVWLSRGVEVEGTEADPGKTPAVEFTEEDYALLREYKIALS